MDQRRAELEQAARLVRDEIAGGTPSGCWTPQELEGMLTEICGEAETLTDESAQQPMRRWL
jgi:hypothetical protein